MQERRDDTMSSRPSECCHCVSLLLAVPLCLPPVVAASAPALSLAAAVRPAADLLQMSSLRCDVM